MNSSYSTLPNLLIPEGSDVSNILNGVHVYHDALGIAFYANEADYGSEVYTIEVNKKQEATATDSDWTTLEDSSGTDIAPPAAGKMKVIRDIIFAGSIRIKADANVAGNREWELSKIWTNSAG